MSISRRLVQKNRKAALMITSSSLTATEILLYRKNYVRIKTFHEVEKITHNRNKRKHFPLVKRCSLTVIHPMVLDIRTAKTLTFFIHA